MGENLKAETQNSPRRDPSWQLESSVRILRQVVFSKQHARVSSLSIRQQYVDELWVPAGPLYVEEHNSSGYWSVGAPGLQRKLEGEA